MSADFKCTLVPWRALLAILAMLHGSSFFEARVDYFLEIFFYVKVQIHAVISCHTKLALLSFHFVVIFCLPPWRWLFLSLVMIGSTESYKKLLKTGMLTSHWSHAATDSLTEDAQFETFSTRESGQMGQRMTSHGG